MAKLGELKKTTEQFIEEARAIHGDKFDYSRSIYSGSMRDITIVCPKHGEWVTNPNRHLSSGRGCAKCWNEIKGEVQSQVERDTFIERSKAIYGDLFDYSKTQYRRAHINVTIRCTKCGREFETTPNHHLSCKRGCGHCRVNAKKWARWEAMSRSFIEDARKIHGDAFDYSKVEYKSPSTKVLIKCTVCGTEKRQSPKRHLDGFGCLTCSVRKSKLEVKAHHGRIFKERAIAIHGAKYNYDKAEYINSDTKLLIGCNICKQDFWQAPDGHIGSRARGCPTCRESRGEKAIRKFLVQNAIQHERQWKPDGGVYGSSHMEYDFKVGNLLIEFDGIQHWWPVERFGGNAALADCIYRDLKKTKWAYENGFHLLRINYNSLSSVESILEDALLRMVSDGAGI